LTSKADKLRRLRIKQRLSAGRPRKDGPRYPSGGLKREETEREAKSVAIEAIKRIHGIDTDGKDGFAGYTLGRMFLDGKVTEEERKAGDEYAQDMERYHRMTGIPSPSPRAQSLFTVKGYEHDITDTMQRKITKATNRRMHIEGLLLRQVEGTQVKSTVYNVCYLDIEALRMMTDTQLRWLKRGLRALMIDKGLQSG